MTGVRIGIIFQAVGAMVTALAISFASGWKLTLIIICFFPLVIFYGKIQGQKQANAGKTSDTDSLTEKGGQVKA